MPGEFAAGVGSAGAGAAPPAPGSPRARAEASAIAAAIFALLLAPAPPQPSPAAASGEGALKTRPPKVEKDGEGVDAGASPAGADGPSSRGFFAAAAAADVAAVAGVSGAAIPLLGAAAPPGAGDALEAAGFASGPESAASNRPTNAAAERAAADPLGIERIESSRLAGRDAVRIDLDTEGLGAVSLRLAVRNGEVTATLLASREATAGLLRPEVEAARAALAAKGVSVGAFVVATPHGAAAGESGGGGDDDADGAGGRVAPVDGRKSRRRRARFDFTV